MLECNAASGGISCGVRIMIDDDIEYYAQRAKAERLLSSQAKDPVSARVHSELAEQYERRIQTPVRTRPTLHIVSPRT